MKRMMIILVLLVLSACQEVYAAPTNTSGPWGIDARGFSNFSTAIASPATAGGHVVITKPMDCNNLTITADRAVDVKKGGRIRYSGNLVIKGPFNAGLYRVLEKVGSGTVVFKGNSTEEIKPQWVGDTGTSDDSAAINYALTIASASEVRRVGSPGNHTIASTIVLPTANYAATTPAPVELALNGEITYTGTNKAISATGNGWGNKVYVKSLVGSGVIAIGTPGGSAENIGMYIGPNSGVNAKIGTVRNFNINILIDGGYFNKVDVDYSIQAIYGILLRTNPNVLTPWTANNNTVNFRVSGGAYLSLDNPDFSTLRLLSCKYGIYIGAGSMGNTINGGAVEYSIRTDDSVGITVNGSHNTVHTYIEGAVATGNNLVVGGDENVLELSGVTSQDLKAETVIITGYGNELSGVTAQDVPAMQQLYWSPHQGQGGYRIDPSTKVSGSFTEITGDVVSGTVHNLVASLNSSVLVKAGAIVPTDTFTDYPSGIIAPAASPVISVVTSSAIDTNSYVTYGPISLAGDARTHLRCSSWIKAVTGTPKVSVFVLDESFNILGSFNTAMGSDQVWKKNSFIFDKGSATAIYLRISVRNFMAAGGAIKVFNPLVTFNINTPEVFVNQTLSSQNVVAGQLIANYMPVSGLILPNITISNPTVTNAIDVRSSHHIIINDGTYNLINSFLNTIPGQEFEVTNISGATITVTYYPTNGQVSSSTSAPFFGLASFDIPTLSTIRLFNYGNYIYRVQ